MNEERELERRLEDFLATTARPMPPDLLADVVRDLGRGGTGAQARFGAGPRWQLGVALVAAGLVVAVAILANLGRVQGPGTVPTAAIASPTPTPTPASQPLAPSAGLRWNPWAYFRIGAAHSNPAADAYGNGAVWSYHYGLGGDPASTIGLLTVFQGDHWVAPPYPSLEMWRAGAGIGLRPWAHNEVARTTILRWTSPIRGRVRIEGYFGGLLYPCAEASDGVSVHIVRDGTALWTRRLIAGNEVFGLESEVVVGTTVSFVVDPGANSNCDDTEVVVDLSTE